MGIREYMEKLFREHHGRLFVVEKTYLKDAEESRDVVSEVFDICIFSDGNGRMAYVKLSWSFDFGRKTERKGIIADMSTNSVILHR